MRLGPYRNVARCRQLLTRSALRVQHLLMRYTIGRPSWPRIDLARIEGAGSYAIANLALTEDYQVAGRVAPSNKTTVVAVARDGSCPIAPPVGSGLNRRMLDDERIGAVERMLQVGGVRIATSQSDGGERRYTDERAHHDLKV